jgi:hypothetical protein
MMVRSPLADLNLIGAILGPLLEQETLPLRAITFKQGIIKPPSSGPSRFLSSTEP